YNQNGEKIGSMELPDEVFGVEVNPAVLRQAVVAAMANMRTVIAHTKDRSEVRGGGKKPWRQKGTGRARHGSIRSPLWVGGGVTFGPTNSRNFKKKISARMKRLAILAVLFGKAKDGELIVLDKLELAAPKTKEMAILIDKVVRNPKTALLMLPARNETIQRAGRNIADFKVSNISNINVLDLLNYKYLVLLEDTVFALKKKYGTS
ncbi:MAG: 50S ribosomal protein L4, partial [Candidatus Spechtbacterales bacterium]